jgi:hypothetical protein
MSMRTSSSRPEGRVAGTTDSVCTPQPGGFTDHEMWDFANTRPDQYPLLLHFPYFDIYRKQVVRFDLVTHLGRGR